MFILAFCISLAFNAGAVDVRPSIGANKFDLFMQYLGTASGGDGSDRYRRVTQAMAKKAIADANDIGLRYFRISASGYAPSAFGKRGDLDMWSKNRAAYWALFDQMMDDLQRIGMRIVPVFVWNASQIPAMTGESVAQMLRNPESKSYRLLVEYVREFAQRYRAHPALYFYELTNELNLSADLDQIKRCRTQRFSELCGPKANFSTEDVIRFSTRFAEVIRSIDRTHHISSGFSVPRSAAQHLRRQPEWSQKGPDWKPDSLEELQKYLADVHKGVDIISVHLYSAKEGLRFGAKEGEEGRLLEAVKQAADRIGKPLFVGEFGEPDPRKAKEGSFTFRILDKLVDLRVPYSAIWAWEFYQRTPHTAYDNQDDGFNLEPGFTDLILAKLVDANRKLGNRAVSKAEPDKVPPRVVLTWPLDCAPVKGRQDIHAVASDNNGAVQRVEFWLGEKKLETDTRPAYQGTLNADGIKRGEYDLKAKAYDVAGNHAEFSSRILVKMNQGKGAQCRPHSAEP
jgi:hypothetical protein